MTDEERAEEYSETVETQYFNEVTNRCYFELWQIEQAYLDGLAEGRKEQWHDLRKDPNDLPNQITLVIMNIFGNTYCNGWFDGDGWTVDGNMRKIDCENVIAWCELPKFKE